MTSDLKEMVALARRYCEIVESAGEEDRAWLGEIALLLPRLHAEISALASPGYNSPHMLVADLDARFELFSHLRELLGERDGYWMEFDSVADTQCMSGSLADDLTDIYCELKHGLRLLDQDPEGRTKVLLEWCRGFRSHWGQHLIDAERHLYALSARGGLAIQS